MALPSPLSDFWVALARRTDQSKTIQRIGIQFKTSGAKICLRNRPTQLPFAQLWPRLQPHLILQTRLSNFFLLALRSETLPQKTIGCDPKKICSRNPKMEQELKATYTLTKMKPHKETWSTQKLPPSGKWKWRLLRWKHETLKNSLSGDENATLYMGGDIKHSI